MLKRSLILVIVASIAVSCTPQTAATEIVSTLSAPTQTSIPPTMTATSTPAPTETALLTDTPSATLPSCTTPVNPVDQATVPAHGPFDFTWTAFEGAASYIVSIGPANWYPTNFPVNGTTLTRFMENFPSSPSYEWSITALDASGRKLCKAGPYAFNMSVDVAATASFSGGVAADSDGNSSSNTSSNSGQGASNNGSSNGSNDGGGSTSNDSLDIAIFMDGDGDNAECRLFARYKIKSNHAFTFLKLVYRYNDQEDSVDFSSGPLDPYPAYNLYNAATPPLPVHHGDTVQFGVWYRTDNGTESKGLVEWYSMSECTQ